jgi:hypothetical protein
MAQVRITGWETGLKKVSLTKLLQSSAGMDLVTAKNYTDRILEGETVTLELPDFDQATTLAEAMEALGAVAREEAG